MLGILSKFFKFKVVDDSPFGKGIVATQNITKGEIIFKFAGPILSLKEFFDKYETNDDNVLQIDTDRFMDVIEPYVYVNHSCDPNAGVRNYGVLFALKEIKVGEEIFFDYSTTVDDVIWSMECRCGSKICRGVIGDFLTVPHERKLYYLDNNALLTHIKRTYF